jgi:hypothetical protein
MQEHEPKEHAAEQQLSQARVQREAQEYELQALAPKQQVAGQPERQESSSERADGVLQATPEQHMEAQRQQAESERDEVQRAHELEGDGQENTNDSRTPGREMTDRQQEKAGRDREQGDEAQRRASVEWYLAKRAFDRARDRDDDRDR